MPLKNYGVLIGRAVDRRAETDRDTPHYQVHVTAADVHYRIAVNVLSSENPPNVLYAADEHVAHPLLAALSGLGDGFHDLPSAPGGAALDFVRANLVERSRMLPLPPDAPGPDNDLAEKIDHYVTRAIADPDARVHAFGERFGPEPTTPDKIFGFSPGNGVHDIHMNQGNTGRFSRDDGVWQDGALLLHFPAQDQWVAIFLAFGSQSWHTDDRTGHALDSAPVEKPGRPGRPGRPARAGRVRLVGALVNPPGPAPEAETVTVLNAGPDEVDLGGWRLADRLDNGITLPAGPLAAGETRRVPLAAPMALGNGGGTITLLDPGGLKVDGVSYTGDDVGEGWTLVF